MKDTKSPEFGSFPMYSQENKHYSHLFSIWIKLPENDIFISDYRGEWTCKRKGERGSNICLKDISFSRIK